MQDDIIAMVAAKTKAPPKRRNTATSDETEAKKRKASTPPFIKHYKTSTDSDGKPYKVGDSKTWNNEVWYFCDCPNHRFGERWHTFKAEECRTRKRWIEKKKKKAAANLATDDPPNDNAGGEPAAENEREPEQEDPPESQNITELLANAMNLVGDNGVLRDIIADAITQADQA